jgi:hypothetical protein
LLREFNNMIYQLPTGKIVHLSLEEYLNLTDEDVQYLISTGVGGSPNNPFYSSALSKPSSVKDKTPAEAHDTSIDYKLDNDDVEGFEAIDLDQLPDE